MKKMQKTAWKNIIPRQYALKIHNRYIHLNSKHARDLKFVIYLPCVVLHEFSVAFLKILLYDNFMAKKLLKIQYGRHFLTVSGLIQSFCVYCIYSWSSIFKKS